MRFVPASEYAGMTRREVEFDSADFVIPQDRDTSDVTVSAGAPPAEVGRLQVGEHSDPSYEAVQIGRPLGPNPDSDEGKVYIDLRDSEGNEVDPRTQVRVMAGVINRDEVDELMGWKRQRGLKSEDSRLRPALEPSTVTDDEGNEFAETVPEGREIFIEVKNTAVDQEVDLEQSTLEIQGYSWW